MGRFNIRSNAYPNFPSAFTTTYTRHSTAADSSVFEALNVRGELNVTRANNMPKMQGFPHVRV